MLAYWGISRIRSGEIKKAPIGGAQKKPVARLNTNRKMKNHFFIFPTEISRKTQPVFKLFTGGVMIFYCLTRSHNEAKKRNFLTQNKAVGAQNESLGRFTLKQNRPFFFLRNINKNSDLILSLITKPSTTRDPKSLNRLESLHFSLFKTLLRQFFGGKSA